METISYSELDNWIANASLEIHDLTVTGIPVGDYTGVMLDEKQTSFTPSAFGAKFTNLEKKGLLINLTVTVPDEVTDLTGFLGSDVSKKPQEDDPVEFFKNSSLINSVTILNGKNVNNIDAITCGCSNMKSITFGEINNVTKASLSFYICSSLSTVDFSIMKNVKKLLGTFAGMAIETADLTQFNNVEDITMTFAQCVNLTKVKWGSLIPKAFNYCFYLIPKVITFEVSGQEATNWLNTNYGYLGLNDVNMYKIINIPETVEYANLQIWANNQKRGDHSVKIIGNIPAEDLKADLSIGQQATSNFSKKFSGSDKFALFNIELDIPANVQDITGGFISDKFLSIKLTGGSGVKIAKTSFAYCHNLKEADISSLENVEDTSFMFSECYSLATAKVGNKPKVTNAKSMFDNCKLLTSADISSMKLVTDISNIFNNCANLISANVKGLTSVVNAENAFSECFSLRKIDISDFKSATNISNIFLNCKNLLEIYWGNLQPSTFNNALSGITKNRTIHAYADAKRWIENNSVALGTFKENIQLDAPDGMFPVINKKYLEKQFSLYSNETINKYEFVSITNFLNNNKASQGSSPNDKGIFEDMAEATFDIIDSFIKNKVLVPKLIWNFVRMFKGCTNLIELPWIDTSNSSAFSSMFEGCTNLKRIPLIDISGNNDFYSRMYDSAGGGIKTSPRVDSMFKNCTKLEYLPELDFSNINNGNDLFNGCNSLTNVPASIEQAEYTSLKGMFTGCLKLKFISNRLNTYAVTSFDDLFKACTALEYVPDLSTEKAISLKNMFFQCEKVESIPDLIIPSGITKTETDGMFSKCTSLTTLRDNSFNNSSATAPWQFKDDIDFGDCPLDKPSILKVFNGLRDFTSSPTKKTITISPTTNFNITSEDKKIAGDKNWTVLVK